MRSLPTLLPLLLCLPHLAQAADTDEWRYTVQRGDTLWSIARQHLRSIAHVPALQQKNAIRDPYVLTPGSVVRIPTQWMRQHTGKATVTDLIGSASLGNGKQRRRTGALHCHGRAAQVHLVGDARGQRVGQSAEQRII